MIYELTFNKKSFLMLLLKTGNRLDYSRVKSSGILSTFYQIKSRDSILLTGIYEQTLKKLWISPLTPTNMGISFNIKLSLWSEHEWWRRRNKMEGVSEVLGKFKPGHWELVYITRSKISCLKFFHMIDILRLGDSGGLLKRLRICARASWDLEIVLISVIKLTLVVPIIQFILWERS